MCPVWTDQEEDFLRGAVEMEGQKPINWILIAKKMNQKFLNATRSGKQCREKYTNKAKFAKSEQSNQKWSEEQVVRLIDKVEEHSSRWSKIHGFFPSRSQNSLKNKFYGELRKMIRNINKIGKSRIKGFSKTIKYESLIRVLQGSEGVLNFKGQLKDQCERLKENILKMMKSQVDPEEVIEFINEIHQFNMVTRCYCAKKPKKNRDLSQNPKQLDSSQKKQMSVEVPGHVSEPIKLVRDKICPFDFFELDQDVGKRIYSENGISADLEEEVSNILGYEYHPMGFSYFEGK